MSRKAYKRLGLRHHKRPSPQLVAIIPCFKAGAADCQRGWILRNVIECRAIRSQVHLFKHHRRLVPVVPICCGGSVEKNFPAPRPGGQRQGQQSNHPRLAEAPVISTTCSSNLLQVLAKKETRRQGQHFLQGQCHEEQKYHNLPVKVFTTIWLIAGRLRHWEGSVRSQGRHSLKLLTPFW